MDQNTLKRLKIFIDRAEAFSATLPTDKTEAEVVVLEFQNYIAQFLDHCFTNFPTGEGRSLYFPRPLYKQSWSVYVKQLDSDKQKISFTGASGEIRDFLSKCYKVISDNSFAVSLIYPKAKHEKPHEISRGVSITGQSANITDSLVVTNSDGSMDIGGNAIHVVGGVKNLRITNSLFNGQFVKELVISHIENGKIVFANTGTSHVVSVAFGEWRNDCISTCKAIFNELS